MPPEYVAAASAPAHQVGVRRAGLDDGPVLADLRRRWTEEHVARRIEDDTFEAAFAEWFAAEQHQRVTWLAEVGGAAVGMLNLLVFTRMPKPRDASTPGSPARWGYVANVYVDPEHRRRGAGGALMRACIAFADESGFARLVLYPSEVSVPLYARAGFGPATSLMVRPGPPDAAERRADPR